MIRDIDKSMIIRISCAALIAAAVGLSTGPAAYAQAKKKKSAEPAAAAGPKKIATHGKWDVYVQAGKAKLCYTLSKAQKRSPANLKDTDGFIFISSRPAQNVRNEVAIKMGFDLKPDAKPTATIGSTKFAMVANGTDLFVENAAEERPFVAALRKGSEVVVRAVSKRGNDTTDHYALSGVGQALDDLQKECK
jgi:invasion protein IalB